MNAVTIFNPKENVPAFARAKGELSAVAKALMGSGGGGKRISVKGGVFRLVSEGKEVASIEERYLDVVIVNAAPKITRTFYIAQFDADNPAAPDCWSADGDTPDKTAKTPQATACAKCPQNIAGSGQGDSRACRFSQRLAVVLANDMEGDVMQLSCAATSIFGKGTGENRPLQEYARWLAAQGHDPAMFVTRLKFDTNSATPKLFFKPMRWLTEDEYDLCQQQGQHPDAIKAVTMSVAQMDKVDVPGKALVARGGDDDEAPAPPPRRAAAAPAPVTAPAVDPEDEPPAPAPRKPGRPRKEATAAAPEVEAEVAEPEVRKSAAPAAPAATKASLASVLSDWDTDD